MNFNDHSPLAGQHAFLSASSPSWVNYDDHKLRSRWILARASARGVALHAYAHEAIRLRILQSRSKKTLYMYINDGIKYNMVCEQTLVYSRNAFGTPDTISFNKKLLRIHDLKTGVTKTSFRQLEVYAAYFCLEYGVDPFGIEMELRIYQNDEILIHEPDPEYIIFIMDRTEEFDLALEALREEEGIS